MSKKKAVVRVHELLDKKTGQLVGYVIGCADERVVFVHETFTLDVDKDGYRTYERVSWQSGNVSRARP